MDESNFPEIKIKKRRKKVKLNTDHFFLATLVALVVVTAVLAEQHKEIRTLSSSVAALQTSLDASISKIENTASSTAASTAADIALISNREVIPEKTEGQLLQEAVAKVTPAVVSIVGSRVITSVQPTSENTFGVSTTTKDVSTGTGFIVRTSGYIVTNKHVVSDTKATYTVQLASGDKKTATVVWRSPSNELSEDLAILKIEGSGYTRIPLGDSSTLRLAQTVFAVGNALGKFNNSVSVGVISGLNRTITASDNDGNAETLTGVIQTDAAINLGNSGGPLVNLLGEAVGINVAVARGSQSVGFSLPISRVRSALANLGI